MEKSRYFWQIKYDKDMYFIRLRECICIYKKLCIHENFNAHIHMQVKSVKKS